MQHLRQYVISITSAALLCGLVSAIVQKGPAKEIVRWICGLILAISVLAPIVRADFPDITQFSMPNSAYGAEAAMAGELLAKEAQLTIIKEQSEAYILDKATELHAEITVEVTVSEGSPPLPSAAVLRGTISPYAKRQLEDILQKELGIAKEDQLWTG